jgi:mannose-6-phosphate isomerase-like protein (cupin superfamily)
VAAAGYLTNKSMSVKPNIFRSIKFGKETFHPQSFNEEAFVMNYRLEKRGMVPPHFHAHMDEHFKVLSGEMKFTINGKSVIKTAGEEIIVQKGVPHSIRNMGEGIAELNVTYIPCADTHRLFEMLVTLDETRPFTVRNLLKAAYLTPKLKLREFSTPAAPAFVGALIKGIINTMGKWNGWDKHLTQFRHAEQE